MKNFIMFGVGGYIAPRHLKAIKETGNTLIAAIDTHDSVGILDSYFPDCNFFTEFERFDRHIHKIKREGVLIDFVVVCSPNYLHDAHIRYGLRIGANVICEKPVVINPWNIDAIINLEKETNKKVFPILQLRYHPTIIKLKEKIASANKTEKYPINLNYITPRGNWYNYSWKGNEEKSGGLLMNIGIHFFDMLIWIFGKLESNKIVHQNLKTITGILSLENAIVNWNLSIETNFENNLPIKKRELLIDGELIDFNEGFEDLHTQNYNKILSNESFTLNDTTPAIKLIYDIKNNFLN